MEGVQPWGHPRTTACECRPAGATHRGSDFWSGAFSRSCTLLTVPRSPLARDVYSENGEPTDADQLEDRAVARCHGSRSREYLWVGPKVWAGSQINRAGFLLPFLHESELSEGERERERMTSFGPWGSCLSLSGLFGKERVAEPARASSPLMLTTARGGAGSGAL